MSNVFAQNVATSAAEAEKIVPRAEFRVFGHGIIEKVRERMWSCAATLHKARKMPAETYFLSANTTEANVKVRDGLLDIKTKTGETPEGYEIFQPRGKFQFPVSKEDLATILGHLKVDIPLDMPTYSIEEFIKMARAHAQLAPTAPCAGKPPSPVHPTGPINRPPRPVVTGGFSFPPREKYPDLDRQSSCGIA